MTPLEQVKEKKTEAEKRILDVIEEFEKVTGFYVGKICIERGNFSFDSNADRKVILEVELNRL